MIYDANDHSVNPFQNSTSIGRTCCFFAYRAMSMVKDLSHTLNSKLFFSVFHVINALGPTSEHCKSA